MLTQIQIKSAGVPPASASSPPSIPTMSFPKWPSPVDPMVGEIQLDQLSAAAEEAGPDQPHPRSTQTINFFGNHNPDVLA